MERRKGIMYVGFTTSVGGYRHVYAVPVLADLEYNEPPPALRAQATGKGLGIDGPFYAVEIQAGHYWDSGPTYGQCTQAAKRLGKIHRAIEKMQEQEGYSRDLATLIGRLARATKCAGIMIELKPDGKRPEYDNIRSLGDGINTIRAYERELIDAGNPTPQPA